MKWYYVYKVYFNGHEKFYNSFHSLEDAVQYAKEEKRYDASEQTECFEVRDEEEKVLWST